MRMIHLKDTGLRIEKVFHLADIHIRLQSRFQEYQTVFHSLYASLRKEQRPSVIVIAGDILHSKTELSPECILVTTDFFRNLSALFPTFVIMGNHDALLNNPDRIDSISAIIRDKHLPDFYYLLDSGYYRYENLVFGVSSLRDGKFMDGRDIVGDDLVRIALYHGGVDRFSTNQGFQMEGSLSCSDFEHYNYVMLGDIHKHQHLRPNIAYSGSLVSQNFGETDPDHGLIEWDLVTDTSRFLRIENEYAHQECFLENNRIGFMDIWYDLTDDIPFRRYARLRINTTDDSWLYAHKTLKERYPGIHSFVHVSRTKGQEETHERSEETDEKMIIERFCREKISDETEREEIFQRILDHIHLGERSGRGGEWTLLELSFDNMFGYGENNVIRFQDIDHSIIGVLGCNSVGKSTLIDILCFALYGRITRQSTIPRELIHVRKRRFRCHVIFRIGSTEYKIEKWGQLDKKDRLRKIEEKFYEIRDGETRDLTDEDRLKTDRKQIIRRIGDMDQFLYTTVCLQNRERSFRDMSQKDRKEFLYGLLRLDWFEEWNKELNQSLQILKKELAHLESRIRSCPEQQIRETLCRLEQTLDREQKLSEQIQKDIEDDQHLASVLTKEIIEFDSGYKKMTRSDLESLLRSIDNEPLDGEFSVVDRWEDEDYVQGLYRSLQKEHTLDPSRYAEYKEHHDFITTFDPSEAIRSERKYDQQIRDLYDRCKITRIDHEDDAVLEKRVSDYRPWDKEECVSVLSLWNEYDSLASELKKIPTDRVEWNMDCPQCIQNPYRHREETLHKEYTEKKTMLRKKRQDLRSRSQKLGIPDKTGLETLIRERDRSSVQDEIGVERDRQTLQDYRWIREAQTVEREKKTRLEEYYRYLTHKKDLVLYETYLEMYENNEEIRKQNQDLHKELDQIEEYKTKKERHRSRLHHREILDTLAYLDKKERLDGLRLDAHHRRYNDCVETMYRVRNEIEQNRQKLEQHNRDRLEHDRLRTEYNKNKQIHSLIQRDGLPLYILQQYVPIIEERINRLLTRFLDKKIRFCVQDDDIVMTLMVDNKSLNYFGGMESFIVDITTKIVFSQIAVFPRCNLFIIDEGISALDKEHIRSLHVLFDFLSRNFPQTWIISHLEIQDVFDHLVSIRKDKDGFSRIEI